MKDAKRISQKIMFLLVVFSIILESTGKVVLADSTGVFLLKIANEDSNYSGTTDYCKDNLTEESWNKLLQTVMGEAGGQGYIGCCLVAQSLRDHLVEDNTTNVVSMVVNHQYDGSTSTATPSDTVKNAVDFVFNQGGSAIKHRVLYFYNPAVVTSTFHESQEYLLTYKDHKFFDNINTTATVGASRDGTYVVLEDTYQDSVESGVTSTEEELEIQYSSGILSVGNYSDSLSEYTTELPAMSGLSTTDRQAIAILQADINKEDESITDYARLGVVMFGILCMIYGVAIIIAYLFERFNTFIDIQLIKILTLGLYYYIDDDDEKTKIGRSKAMNMMGAVFLMIKSEVVGLVCISGMLFKVLRFLFEKFIK